MTIIPKHTAKITQEFLQKKKGEIMTWPNMSPDLNPIEQLQNILNWKLEQQNPSSKEQLKIIICEHLSAVLCKTGIIHVQEVQICHQK